MWPLKKKKKKYNQKRSDEEITKSLSELEKSDIPAIFIAAMITFVPVVLVICGLIYLFIYLLFIR